MGRMTVDDDNDDGHKDKEGGALGEERESERLAGIVCASTRVYARDEEAGRTRGRMS
jgi:hypothetical protein